MRDWFYRWFQRPKMPPAEPERLLFATGDDKPKVGSTCQSYTDRNVVTRVEKIGCGYYHAYGRRIGPSSGPGTEPEQQQGKGGGG